MKKFVKSLLFLCLSLFFSSVSAQSSVLEQIKEMDLQELLRVYSSLPQYGMKTQEQPSVSTYAMMRSVGHTATERVRIPDLSKKEDPKYYYIKNVKTGLYLHYEGGNAIGLVDTPDENSKFYLQKHGLALSTGGGSLHNSVDGKLYTGPLNNSWIYDKGNSLEELSNPSPAVNFYPTPEGTGCYITDDFIEDEEGVVDFDLASNMFVVNKSWRVENGAVVVGACDEYAIWVVEPLPSQPEISSIDAPTWYVVKNVNTGMYLHYQGENAPMSLVTSPDPCSLFFATASSGGIEIHNYVAGDLLYSDVNQWTSTATPVQFVPITPYHFFVSVSGDEEGNDIWYHNENDGILATGSFGENSLWEFEEISNLKEIFGYSLNGENTQNAYKKYYELLNNMENLNPFEAYVQVLECLVDVLIGSVGYVEKETLEEIEVVEEEIDKIIEALPKNINGDAKIYNVSYSDNEGGTLLKSLSTNSSSLLVNDADHSHTNVWQVLTSNLDINSGISIKLYNTVTKKYVSSPSYSNGAYTVSMTSDVNRAGDWIVDLDLGMEGDWVYLETEIEAKNVAGCYLQLASPDDITVSCTTNSGANGIEWVIAMSSTVLDKRVYDCAAESAVIFPQLLQESYGAVTADFLSESNADYRIFPQVETRTIKKLYDGFVSTSVWTDETNDLGNKHYIMVDLGEGTSFSGFYFYLRPNVESWMGVPLSVKVEGSHDHSRFETLAENIEMPTLMYDMCYFSELINQGGDSYRYLRFTVNNVSTGENAREFALSEFYVLPNIPEVAEASRLIRAFHAADFMGAEIVEPAVALIMREAEYYLGVYENNHADIPELGGYPTSKYNALKTAYNTAKANINNAENVLKLVTALEEFKKSKLTYICMFESAWEDGFSKGAAMAVDFDGYLNISEANPWDMRQWGVIDRGNDKDNPFTMTVLSGEEIPFHVEEINGWSSLYASKKKAYNISIKFENEGELAQAYLVVQEYKGELRPFVSEEPATTSTNQQAAWYINIIANSDRVAQIKDRTFIEALANFGKIFGEAKHYQEGYLKGRYYYEPSGDLTYGNFYAIYSELEPYYSLGAVALAEMYLDGGITEDMLSYLNWALGLLEEHFDNFVELESIAGYYFRLCGKNGYLTSDANGNFSISQNRSEANVFYTAANGSDVYLMSFSSGRYVRANANGTVGYDAIPLDGSTFTGQNVRLGYPLSGNEDYATVIFGDGYYLSGSSTGTIGVTTSPQNNGDCEWGAELIEEEIPLPISISSAQYATLYVPVELKIPGGVTAYVLFDEATNSNNERVLRLKELQGGVIPAGLSVILQANEGVYNFSINYNPTLYSETAKRATYCYDGDIENLLDGRHATTFIPAKAGYIHYILANGSKGVGMYKVKMDDATVGGVNYFQNNAHRAWLPNPATRTTGAAGYRFSVAGRGETTGIDAAIDDSADAEIYDLQGRRVSHMVKGVYIVNGKKVIK